MRFLLPMVLVAILGGCSEEFPYFIPGTGTLPADCNEDPVTNLNGTSWFDTGTVTVLTAGCDGAAPDDFFTACGLPWQFVQVDNDIEILVDNEYRINGLLCGDTLSLEGGWWLSVEDEGLCYEEDSAEEVGIMAEGNELTVNTTDMTMTGTLVVQGSCRATYGVTFFLN